MADRGLQVKAKRSINWLIAAVLLFGIVWGWSGQMTRQSADRANQAILEVNHLIQRERRNAEIEEANACVNQWNRVSELRDVIVRVSASSARSGAVAGAGAVGTIARELGSDVPDLILVRLSQQAAKNAATEAEIASRNDLRAYPNPACNLGEARATLERLDGGE